jgi:SynChlorMet cassette radical SAM/SPASM protein ScmF
MKEKNIPPLSTLYFYMTEGCNLACQHCWLSPKLDEDGSKYPVINVELFKNIIYEAKPLGLKYVKLTGGEPLMHPEIQEILKIIAREELVLRIETNGMLCDEKIAREIAKCNNAFVSVSLDGATAEVHDKIRGVSGAFDRTVKGIKNLIASGINTQIIFSIMRDNIHQYNKIIEIGESLGVGSIKYNIIQPTERGQILHEQQKDVTVEEYIEIGKNIEECLSPITHIALLYDHPVAFRPLHHLADPLRNGGTCGIKQILGVLADGTYALCGIGMSIQEMTFGKAGVDALKKVWEENTMLNAIRFDLPETFEGICAKCLMKEKCLGACIAQNYYRTRNVKASFWYCEAAYEKGLFPLSRLVG